VRHLLNAPLIAASVLIGVGVAWPAHAQDFVPLFSRQGLTGWTVEHIAAVDNRDAIRISGGNGWVRTQQVFSDFILRLEMRMLNETSEAGVFVRAWPTFNADFSPNNGYQVRFAANRIEGPAFAEWRRVEVECVGPKVTVRVEGAAVHSTDGVESPQGHVAVWARSGSAEFRNIQVKEFLPTPSRSLPAGVFAFEAVPRKPKVRTEVRPRYTASAMAAKIQGTVWVAAVVLPDGTVGDARVVRSLDPVHGLDEIAVAAARQWRFVPGERDGLPVPVAVTIEISFKLR
jgi:TonB family protein